MSRTDQKCKISGMEEVFVTSSLVIITWRFLNTSIIERPKSITWFIVCFLFCLYENDSFEIKSNEEKYT